MAEPQRIIRGDRTDEAQLDVTPTELQAYQHGILDSTDDLVWMVAVDRHTLVYFNRALDEYYRQHHGIDLRTGMSPVDFMSPERAALWDSIYERALADGTYLTTLQLEDKSTMVEVSCYPVVIHDQVTGIAVRAKNITVAGFRQVAETANCAIYIFDGYHILFANRFLHAILGYNEKELLTIPLKRIIHPDHWTLVHQLTLDRFAGHAVPDRYEIKFVTKSMHVRWAEISTSLIDDYQGAPAILGVALDITARKEAEEAVHALNIELEHRVDELLEYQTQLRRLTVELAQTEERERRHIAQTLHDNLGQMLAFLYMKAGWLNGRVTDTVIHKVLKEMMRLLQEAIHQTRALTFELSPPALYNSGFEPGLEQLAASFKQRFELEVVIERSTASLSVTHEQAMLLYVCVRELLTNTVKHAQVNTVVLNLQREGQMNVVIIEDHGIGFDPSQIDPEHFGLFSIGERLKAANGGLQIETSPGHGTRMRLQLPVVSDDMATG